MASRFIAFTISALFGLSSALAAPSYSKNVRPLLEKYCYSCHGNGKKKADLALDAYKDEAALLGDRRMWEKVLHNVRTREMPPENKPQPTPAERDLIAGWIDAEIFKCDCSHPDPGRVTLRRLNRTEYNNTIRDLVGVNFQPADDFPMDDIGYGFDNIGDVLSLPPVLLEKYLGAATKVLDAALVTEPPKPLARKFPGGVLPSVGEVSAKVDFPKDGEYILRARAYGDQAGPEPARMALRLADKELKKFDVPVRDGSPGSYEVRLPLKAGVRQFAAAFLNDFYDPKGKVGNRDRNLHVLELEVVGPIETTLPTPSETHRRIIFRQPSGGNKIEVAREIIGHFAQRAFRRPVTADEVNRLVKFVELAAKEGESFEKGIKLALSAVLVSPHFLFRGELQPEPDNPKSVHPINEYALASRLSYFLWSSMPDDTLFQLAEKKSLRKNLEAQVKRMLLDPKSRALVDNFAAQWLQLRNLQQVSPDPKQFATFDEPLRVAMQKETELFFETILRENRSVLDFLDANYTFVNERLARHYGLAGISGEQYRRVFFKNNQRGGILTHASILTITSNPTRTSPVKRGKWVLENILGTPPPPPPPDVPELSEDKSKVLSGSLRQRMEQHRENPLCASCHARMDPIGFGFENFDGIGAWREKDGDFPVDPVGKLVSGESFNTPGQLRLILLKSKNEEFVHCLSEKMLTYALGRGLEYYDKCALEQIAKGLAKNKYKFASFILEVVKSVPFQQRRGEGDRLASGSP